MSQRFLSALFVLSVVCYASAQSTCTATSGSNLTVTCANGTYPIFEVSAHRTKHAVHVDYALYVATLIAAHSQFCFQVFSVLCNYDAYTLDWVWCDVPPVRSFDSLSTGLC